MDRNAHVVMSGAMLEKVLQRADMRKKIFVFEVQQVEEEPRHA
jgi:hypothetical protein